VVTPPDHLYWNRVEKIPNQTSCIFKRSKKHNPNNRNRHHSPEEMFESYIKKSPRDARDLESTGKWSGSGLDSPPSFASRAHQEPYDEPANEHWQNPPCRLEEVEKQRAPDPPAMLVLRHQILGKSPVRTCSNHREIHLRATPLSPWGVAGGGGRRSTNRLGNPSM
jgi:hypothetical protein